jgi:hypothetical protein
MVAKFSYLTIFMFLSGIFSGICLLGIPVYFLIKMEEDCCEGENPMMETIVHSVL